LAIKRIEPGLRLSKAVVHGNLVFTSGQVDSSSIDVAGQTERILAKIDALLRQSGSDRSQVLSANIWLSDIATFPEMNRVWESWINPGESPARATVESRLAAPENKVEIAVIAALCEAND
jgi:enamine deaminase RidA (YjgF/YER057c/UK114 family)